MKFSPFIFAAALACSCMPAQALSINTNEGHRILLVEITDEDVSHPREIREALKKGGRIRINWEVAHEVDENFSENNVASVFCSNVKKAKDFDPETAPIECVPTNPALWTWIGKHNWQLHSGLVLGSQMMIFVKPWSEH